MLMFTASFNVFAESNQLEELNFYTNLTNCTPANKTTIIAPHALYKKQQTIVKSINGIVNGKCVHIEINNGDKITCKYPKKDLTKVFDFYKKMTTTKIDFSFKLGLTSNGQPLENLTAKYIESGVCVMN